MIDYQIKGRVALVNLNRPERANALDAAHWQDLAKTIRCAPDDGARAIVLSGSGNNFCAGGDLNEPDYDSLVEHCQGTMDAIAASPAPVVAFVNGPAIGAGCQLAISCDLRVGGNTARFAFPAASISLGAHPTFIQQMIASAGYPLAKALLLGGEAIEIDQALKSTLVHRAGTHLDAVSWGEQIASYAPIVLDYFKKELAVSAPGGDARFAGFLAKLLASDDYAEAQRARVDNRSPNFMGS